MNERDRPNGKNPPWERDELILALNLYFDTDGGRIGNADSRIEGLSELLNRLPIHEHRPDARRFRNANGVWMKLANFRRFDPSYPGKGLTRGNKLEQDVWNEFFNNREYLSQVASAIASGGVSLDRRYSPEDTEEAEFPEGRVLYRLHRSRERNSRLVAALKSAALRDGTLYCTICRFDFEKQYGEIGRGFIECHHTLPISEYKARMVTKLQDLVLVCPNCHRMLHRRRPWLTVEKLASVLAKTN